MIRNSHINMTTGIEAFFASLPVGASGGNGYYNNYAQVVWDDIAGLTNRIQTVGYVPGTLAAAGTATLDLTAFPGADGSTTITFTKLSVFYAQIVSTTVGGKLAIGNAASDAHPLWFSNANDIWTINANGPGLAGGDLVSASGITVDATHKNILLTNTSGVSVDYVLFASGLT